MIKRYFCDIDEAAAKAANDANNMADYKEGNATAIYRARVEEIYKIVYEIEEKPTECAPRFITAGLEQFGVIQAENKKSGNLNEPRNLIR